MKKLYLLKTKATQKNEYFIEFCNFQRGSDKNFEMKEQN